MFFRKSLEQIDAEILADASTRTTTSRANLRAQLDEQIKQYLDAGGVIHQVNTCNVIRRDVFNRPISERSSRILESFDTHKQGRGR